MYNALRLILNAHGGPSMSKFMIILPILSLQLISPSLFANDGGIAAIKVNELRMREEKFNEKTNKLETVRKIANPNFVITFSGGEAKKLQKILPSKVSVLTLAQPELASVYNESFKTLGIYSDRTSKVSAKALSIRCWDAEEIYAGDRASIKKLPETKCEISIEGVPRDIDPSDLFGNLQSFEPAVCAK
jgi:hypothetical protein